MSASLSPSPNRTPLATLQAEYATYLAGRPWWEAPNSSPKYRTGKVLAERIAMLSERAGR